MTVPPTINLQTSLDTYYDLALRLQSKGARVSISKATLQGLVNDHRALLGALKGLGATLVAPKPKAPRRSRERL